jgi:uncharacterized DUF497 family protein
MQFEIDWDDAKAASYLVKHKVSFEDATVVFREPLARTRPDPDSSTEQRWITIGMSYGTKVLLVVHTHVELRDDHVYIRIISARSRPKTSCANMSKPSKSENAPVIDDMRPEYDFTDAVRGKFYRADAVLVTPVRLEPEVLAYLQALAEARGVSLNRIVNDLLKKDIELIEAVRWPLDPRSYAG